MTSLLRGAPPFKKNPRSAVALLLKLVSKESDFKSSFLFALKARGQLVDTKGRRQSRIDQLGTLNGALDILLLS